MAGDIEDFLRRAAERRARQQQQRPRPTAPPRVLPEIEILDAEVVEPALQPSILRGDSVAEHVSEHMAAGVFDKRLARLGEHVDRADDRMEAHLHDYFEHQLGDLGTRTSAAEDSILDDDSPAGQVKHPPVSEFVELLRNPTSLRQAIILREILERPRW